MNQENWIAQPSPAQYIPDQFGPESLIAIVGSRSAAIESPKTLDLDAPDAIDSLRREMSAEDRFGAIHLALNLIGAQKHVSGAAVVLESRSVMVCVATVGAAPPFGTPIDLEIGLSADCVRASEPIYCEDTATDPRVDPAVSEMLQIGSLMIVPMVSSGSVVGLVEVFSAFAYSFSEQQRSRIQEISVLLAEKLRSEASLAMETLEHSAAV